MKEIIETVARIIIFIFILFSTYSIINTTLVGHIEEYYIMFNWIIPSILLIWCLIPLYDMLINSYKQIKGIEEK